ncbi:rhamnosyltransferase WsaF family glycosyltransferase [Nocardioides sp. MAHUQ-72]|uniref:rhamnosyltransferase WsaF family glycosyltransferase n=1 Tax=unclassified Nocardioides TaxID=2615069 RepID=UPI0036232673
MTRPGGVAGLARKLRAEGAREGAKRVVRRAYRALDAGSLDFPLLDVDIADSTRLLLAEPLPVDVGRPLRVGWVTTPPGPGSGGHTTMFRMIAALERHGHTCVVLLYDRHHGSLRTHEHVIRSCWPDVRAEVAWVDDGIGATDACVATSWATAHVLALRSEQLRIHRLYLVQDYEPYFYARGSEYELAADTYRFGFTNVALGRMVQERLTEEIGVSSELLPFSCDTTVYRRVDGGPRSGIVFYAKPDVPRRGYRLGILALAEFHRRHPDQEIRVYGDPLPELQIPVTRLSRLAPSELNEIYNRSVAGLALSFTNISLVAEEMLAAGCVPIVNDAGGARADLDNPHVAWAPATPGGLADALCEAVEAPDAVARSEAAAQSVRTDDWRVPGDLLEEIIRTGAGIARVAVKEAVPRAHAVGRPRD